MKLPFFASFIVFGCWLTYEISKHTKIGEHALDEFFEKEQKANETRNKPLDDLNYIQIPWNYIPKTLLAENDTVKDCISTLEQLSDSTIVNFTGYTNTDLKLMYGAGNITKLSEFDENFTLYARTMDKLAHCYHENGYDSNAQLILEACVAAGSDISSTYVLLASLYEARGSVEKMSDLWKKIEALPDTVKPRITHALTPFRNSSMGGNEMI